MPPRDFWTDEQIARAEKMVANGVPKYEIDRYFGRAKGSTQNALYIRANPGQRERVAAARKRSGL